MRLRKLAVVLRETVRQWREEDIIRLGASVAYYAVFSLIPLLLVGAAILSAFYSAEQTENRVFQTVKAAFGEEAAATVEDAVEAINQNGGFRSVTALVSVATLIFASTGMFRQLKSALNVIWEVPPPSPSKVKNFIRDTVQSFVLTLGLGILLLLAMVGNAVLLSAVGSLGTLKPDLTALRLWQIAGVLSLFAITTGIFTVIYKYLPDAHIAWRDVGVGAAVTALLFTVGQYGLGLLLDPRSMNSVYGAASALMFVFIWVNISAHLILFGAEFTQVYANKLGSKIQTAEEYNAAKTDREAEQRGKTRLVRNWEQPIER
ncbi:MAG: YihY/virulence factor BrkB family protein [Chloroflexi bacterium]|nr:YihY/virulence factor BrkB family protein [Chloroflexota bacterium]